MKLVLEFSDDTVQQLNAGFNSEAFDHLSNTLNSNGVVFDSKIIDSSFPAFKFFIVDVNSKEQGHLILEELTKYNIILSGYFKPADEPPTH